MGSFTFGIDQIPFLLAYQTEIRFLPSVEMTEQGIAVSVLYVSSRTPVRDLVRTRSLSRRFIKTIFFQLRDEPDIEKIIRLRRLRFRLRR